ncbi:oligosaccharyl transferase delta subunit [Vararia minispora EC-137]|uniref:Oligosaccharyl transferase delta subunit n=1 Tax=Vararia minispora EC-137 TaxID=1314806 RepID=A0ACB8QVG2_9AGAM|nr:oligosaccharyl transferase delta subunit [Vararia minispora EC-137]
MLHLPSLSLPLLAAVAAQAAQLALQAPRVTVAAVDGSQLLSEQIPLGHALPAPVALGPKDSLKLTFQVVQSGSQEPVQPHQTFIHFYDETTGEEGVQPVKVNANGKAKFELNMARPPSSLPPTGDTPLKVSLFLGSFVHDPAKYDLFDLAIPGSAPVAQHPEAELFRPRAAIYHTFRPEPKIPPVAISGIFTCAVLAPWLALLGLWAAVRPTVPHLFSPNILSFSMSLAGMEGLLLWYWFELRLGQVLLYGALMAIPTFFTGKSALASIAARRLGQK